MGLYLLNLLCLLASADDKHTRSERVECASMTHFELLLAYMLAYMVANFVDNGKTGPCQWLLDGKYNSLFEIHVFFRLVLSVLLSEC